ncbi:MAG: radical SAM family heme chaperone HemW [Woeseiaceae bacterium]|nr:radical SAM family heme chaperone HemW [Woeseiaceae bacterium]
MTALLPPLSLYVHLPWCVAKCPYCDFNSWRAGDDAPRGRYVDALLVDLQREAKHAVGRPLISVFLGGGTPSLFSPAEIGRILDGVAHRFALADDVEVTMEANPGTVECGAPAGYRAAGVNRLSIGAQSFDDSALAALGRIHGSGDIRRAVDAARRGGFENLNLDIMYALPGQDVAAALADLAAAIELAPEHLSWYQLTLEPNTVFYARPPAGLPDNDRCGDIQDAGQAYLVAQAFRQYEVSAWARDGRRCRHNLNYWTFGDYAAVGAGAHGKITQGDRVFRYVKPAHPQAYLQAIESGRHQEWRAVDADERLFEFMLNALRLSDGFDEGTFEARTGLTHTALAAAAQGGLDRGLLERSGRRSWRPTALGRRFLDDLQQSFLA